jgi:hypothetical protein
MNDENTVAATETKKEVIKQNGIKRPDSGTVTGKLWDIADEISKEKGRPALRSEVVARYMAEQPNANQATANTQYARWVTFHGANDAIRSLRSSETAERRSGKDKEREEAKAAREAEKKAKAEAAAADRAAKAAEKEAKKKAIEEERARVKAEKEAEKARKAAAKEAEKAAAAAAAAPAENAAA